VRNQPVSIHEKFVAFGFAAEDRMVVEHEASLSLSCVPLENQCPGQAADATTDNHTVVGFMGVDHIVRKAFKAPVANLVAGLEPAKRIAVRVRIVADAAVAGPIILFRTGVIRTGVGTGSQQIRW
jgi:hypothetical protein